MEPIILIGFMGAGKTTISQYLGKALSLPVVDLDAAIEKEIDQSIADFFAQKGERAFRKLETRHLAKALQTPQVIATGGGIIENKQNQQLLADQQVIYLKAAPEVLLERIRLDQQTIRPLAATSTDLKLLQLYEKRQATYQSLAKLTIDTTDLTPEQITARIIKEVKP